VTAIWGCGNLGPMSASDLEFRWTLGVSLLAHAAGFGVAWISAAMQVALPQMVPNQRDVWSGTTVSVVEVHREPKVPPRLESGSTGDQSGTAVPPAESRKKVSAATTVADVRKKRASAAASKNGVLHQGGHAEATASPDLTVVPRSTPTGAAADHAPLDLKQAMQHSLNQPASESGSFGAAGVDLTERRLPKALTRALPVAIGAEPGWWKQHTGSLGVLRFKVALSENGKLEEVTIDDENKFPFHARVVRRVAKLLALGTFALSTSSTRSTEQVFELRLVMEQQSPEGNSTADPGDLVEKGFEAPSADRPGQAIIRDAPGHAMRAFLKLLPPRSEATDISIP